MKNLVLSMLHHQYCTYCSIPFYKGPNYFLFKISNGLDLHIKLCHTWARPSLVQMQTLWIRYFLAIAGRISISYLYNHAISHLCNSLGIKHGFACINIHQVTREMVKTKGKVEGIQHLPRDLVNLNPLLHNNAF